MILADWASGWAEGKEAPCPLARGVEGSAGNLARKKAL